MNLMNILIGLINKMMKVCQSSLIPVFDYAKNHPEYDGVIIFTDGYADHPKKKPGTKAKFVWVLTSEAEYNEHKDWMKQTGKSCFLTA